MVKSNSQGAKSNSQGAKSCNFPREKGYLKTLRDTKRGKSSSLWGFRFPQDIKRDKVVAPKTKCYHRSLRDAARISAAVHFSPFEEKNNHGV